MRRGCCRCRFLGRLLDQLAAEEQRDEDHADGRCALQALVPTSMPHLGRGSSRRWGESRLCGNGRATAQPLQDDSQFLDPDPLFNERIGTAGGTAPCLLGLGRDDHDLGGLRSLTNPLDEAGACHGREALVKDHCVGSLRGGQGDRILVQGDQRHYLAPRLLQKEARQLSLERLRSSDQDPERPSGRPPSRGPVQTRHHHPLPRLDTPNKGPSISRSSPLPFVTLDRPGAVGKASSAAIGRSRRRSPLAQGGAPSPRYRVSLAQGRLWQVRPCREIGRSGVTVAVSCPSHDDPEAVHECCRQASEAGHRD